MGEDCAFAPPPRTPPPTLPPSPPPPPLSPFSPPAPRSVYLAGGMDLSVYFGQWREQMDTPEVFSMPLDTDADMPPWTTLTGPKRMAVRRTDHAVGYVNDLVCRTPDTKYPTLSTRYLPPTACCRLLATGTY